MIKKFARVAAHTLRVDQRDLAWLALLVVSFPIIFLTAWLASAVAFALAVAASYVSDLRGQRRTAKVFDLLEGSQLGAFPRQVARDSALLLFAWRAEVFPASTLAVFAAGIMVYYGVHAAFVLVRMYVVRLRTLPVETRNVDLDALRIPDTPRAWFLVRAGSPWLALATVPALTGVLLDDALGTTVFGMAGAVATVAIALAALTIVLIAAVRARHLGDRTWVTEEIRGEIMRYGPEVMLYHSGPEGTAYQVNMWLSTLEALDRRVLVMLRQPEHLSELAPTALPVACIPSGSDVMDFDLPSVKVVLYVGNVGDNQHMIRHSSIKHVFIGHGDSDKSASANRVSRIYDEIWVAGPAGRARYHHANVGVADDAIVEVGRPQLGAVERRGSRTGGVFTVLYAPTWEGWSTDMFLTSVQPMGESIVRLILEMGPGVRLVYKPHPMTGLRSSAVRRAHSKIIKLIASANDARAGAGELAGARGASQPSRDGADTRIAQLTARVAHVHARLRVSGDAAQVARDSQLDRDAIGALHTWEAELHDLFWEVRDPGEHIVVGSQSPSLYSCFNQSDLLISDISSVVSDFTVSDKPYVVTNPANLGEEDFYASYPSTGGAYLLGRDCAELPAIMIAVRGPQQDSLVQQRGRAREHLLGRASPDAVTRFSAAIEALIARGDAQIPSARKVPGRHRGEHPPSATEKVLEEV